MSIQLVYSIIMKVNVNGVVFTDDDAHDDDNYNNNNDEEREEGLMQN